MTDVESLTASLVREYLSRKGLKRTLQVLDQELPRQEHSISNRAVLAKEVRIEKLIKKNKEQALVFRTMLEVMVQYMREKGHSSATTSTSYSAQDAQRPTTAQQSHRPTSTTQESRKPASTTQESPRPTSTTQESHKPASITQESHKPTSITQESHRPTVVTNTPQKSHRPTIASARERKSPLDKLKIDVPQSHELEDPDQTNQDYNDLLRRLEKSEQPTKTREVLHPNTPISLAQKPLHHSANAYHTPSSTPRAKTPRTRTRSAGLGGPVVSSGLAGGRDKRGASVRSFSSELSITGHRMHMDKVKGSDENELRGTNWGRLEDNNNMAEKESHVDSKALTVKNVLQLDIENKSVPPTSEDTKLKKSSRPMSSLPKKSSYQPQSTKRDELVFEDIDDDLDESLGSLSLGSSHQIEADFESKPISLEQAMALKNLLFGSANSCFNQEWRQQSFNFCDHYGLEYGIVQHKGGPCGVLAAVQAFVLKSLLFGDQRKADSKQCLQPTPRDRSKALATAITEILWRAGQGKSAIVALPTGFGNSNFIGAGRYKPDQLTENLVLRTFSSQGSLQSYVNQQIKQFEDPSSSGCILLLYSAILSRSIKRLTADMDDSNNKLMGAHGYCSQEMVNLITTGKATSNAFDNTIELDSGGGSNVMILKGLEKQAEVGLLSLFEHYGSCQVGEYYKTPRYPIWVICSESHFSVLFSTDRTLMETWERKKKFDLYYYDGLARQEEEIRLTIDTSRECPESKDEDLVPPLEHVIRTRWKKASIDWNGSEPIL